MKLGKLYELAVNEGMKKDPRGLSAVNKILTEAKSKYRKLKGADKLYFDKESLRNPYSDTRILYGNPEREVQNALVGIDMEVPEVLLADRLNQDGKDIDLIITHHPEGKALAGLYEVMHVQKGILIKTGMAPNVAKDLMDRRIGEVERGIHAVNHMRVIDAARLLDMPFMSMHTVADNFVASFLQNLFNGKKPKKVGDIVNLLNNIPEYKNATINKAGPKIIAGKKDSKAGKVLVDMTGGTEGSENIFARLSQAGIGTLVCMHLSEKHFTKIKDEYINVVVAGHIASDNLGLNMLLDKLENKSGINVLACSGFKRVRR
ncbi:MAG: NGG1p interacting factor NIF3 [Candidatus Omnitrophica bacterium CG07_land_8_20_14_0_80_42_15]|uniref:NGG1p interacting factor NIF3 n=1 Tax=Candidatus Aquitaenariimonas noxiae TaxID=1974741 RepID=A0A2J0L478_9BACT|nr:MAG: NGG1p interacting factor NIF3 [Candidatus Omnitrophica bacterium CG07_land_8_20_14_0_80_42_15]